MRAHGRREPLLRHGAERGARVERVIENVLPGEIDEAAEESVIHVGMHVNALDAAAALSGIEIAAIDQVFDRVRKIGVAAYIGRILAAELKADAGERAGRRLLDCPPGADRSGEADL